MAINDLTMDKALGLMPTADTELTGAVEDIAMGKAIGKKEIAKAIETLKKYKEGKQTLEDTIVENEQWFRLRHWEVMRQKSGSQKADKGNRPEPKSAWLFNSLMNKHSDFMDNYPEPNILPRQMDDKEVAKTLSDVVPVILERNDFEQTYSDCSWYKLKHGTSVYGTFWNPTLEDGLGDVDIRKIDLLNLFWEPGISDVQDSRNLFIVTLKDKDLLEQENPNLKGKLGGSVIEVAEYVQDDTIDKSDKALVVDWYYKKAKPANAYGMSAGHVLHYCKFVGDEILFASENDPAYADGWYEHGEYPVDFDVLFPEEGTPYGFGHIALSKDPQTYIDKLQQLLLESAAVASKPRYWKKKGVGVNAEQFLDLTETLVEVEGDIDEEKLRAIDVPSMPSNVLNLLQLKIDELKETSSNRDVSQGGTGSGVTAAAAIAALQEAGNKTSRDMISASYRTYKNVVYKVIELIRQFYDESRHFRITGENGQEQFTTLNNEALQAQPIDPAFAGQQATLGYEIATRRPVFDIMVKPEKRSAYSRLSQNELAKELYGLGLFNPENAEQAMTVLNMMSFDGIEEVKQKVSQGHTLLNMVKGLQMQMQKMNEAIFALTGRDALAIMNGGGMQPQQSGTGFDPSPSQIQQKSESSKDTTGGKQTAEGKTAMTNYGERLAKRATPKMGE